jgi:5-methylthioadenosine/S-adenosylhomocysteine deaminase
MSLEPADLLIEARWVLPIAPANTVLADHAVAVRAGRIVALGPSAEMSARFEPRERVVRRHHALLPGLVNSHTRAAMTLLRGLPVQGPRGRWLRETVSPAERSCMSPDFVRDGTRLALGEMLRAGVTSFADMYMFPEEAARVASTARIRTAIGLPISDATTAWADGATAHFAKAERLWDEYKSDPWVCLYFAPQAVDEISDDTLIRVRRVADELDARVAIEVAIEMDRDRDVTGADLPGGPLRRLEGLGLLRPGFAAIQPGDFHEQDLDIILRTGISIVSSPQSSLRLGGGTCRVERLHARQAVVGFGTGDPPSAGALDILAEARIATLTAKGHGGSLCAQSALWMATLGGATALGLGSAIGSIEPDKAADLICIDLESLGCLPTALPADSILFGATRQQVSDVWTSGREAVSGGQLLAFDEEELAELAHRWEKRIHAGEPL